MYEAGGRVGSAVQARVCARRASSNARARVKPSKPVHELAGVCKVARANGPQSAAASRCRRPLALFVPRRLHVHHAGDISITCLPTTPAPRQPASPLCRPQSRLCCRCLELPSLGRIHRVGP
jgi:hypothetical protein